MYGYSLLALLGLTLLIPVFDGGSDTPDEPTPPSPDDEDIPVGYNDSVNGTEGNDRFVRDQDVEQNDALGSATVSAGAGDDTIALYDETADSRFTDDTIFDIAFDRAVIDGGLGNDVIDVVATYSTVSGGEGDDTITVHGNAAGATILGGEGDDVLSGEQGYSDAALLDGGAGNDTIDIRDMESVRALGGDGDDQIYITGVWNPGAAYIATADGQAGDDTISYEGGGITLPEYFEPTTLTGGEGADTFELTLDEGGALIDASTVPLEGGTHQLYAVDLADFDPEEDTLIVDPEASSAGFSYVSASLQTAATQGGGSTTQLVLHYESDTETDRDVIIDLGDVEIALSDITFVGVPAPSAYPPTDGDDTLTDADLAGLTRLDTLDMGAGNDSAVFEEPDSVSSLYGNDGNDTLSVGGFYLGYPVSLIDGGDGDDVITASGDDVTLQGGAGDDVISNFYVEGGYFAANHEMSGGEGDDTISVLGAFNSTVSGGEGDDLIIVSDSYGSHGMQNAILANGDVGDDTISFTGDIPFSLEVDDPVDLFGGEGADVFDLTIDGGIEIEPRWDGEITGVYMVELGDFDPSEDTLVITPISSDENLTFSGAEVDRVDRLETTHLVLHFDDEDGLARDIVIELGDVMIELSDIVFLNADAA